MKIMSIKILLVDDQALMRDGIRMLLELEADFSLVAEACNGVEALSLYKQHRPDVVLMDIEMPKMNGIDATQHIKNYDAQANILVLTTFGQEDYIRQALLAGAQGFVLKAISSEELTQNIRSIFNGETVLDNQSMELLINSYRGMAASQGARSNFLLSTREAQIIKLMANKLSNREIAEKLDLAEGTVKNYISQIYEKLNVKDRNQAIEKANELGLLNSENL
jgi:DNA-binding NarL/FixJ family response regulator